MPFTVKMFIHRCLVKRVAYGGHIKIHYNVAHMHEASLIVLWSDDETW